MSNKSVWGLDENMAAVVSYAGLFFSGVAVYAMEKENKFVRFHALQSTVVFLAYFLVKQVFNIITIPLLSGMIVSALDLAAAIIWIGMMWTAYQGKTFKIPVIGDVVWQQVNK